MTTDEGQPTGRRFSAAQRRDVLLDMAAQLVVTESIDSVSMELVAERCDVSRPLVYKHFANRDEMLGAVYSREAQRLHDELAEQVRAADGVEGMFRVLIRGALQATADRGHLLAALRAAGGSSRGIRREQRRRDSQTFRAFVKRAVDELGIDPRLGPTTISLLLSLVDPVLAQWRREPTPRRAALLEESYMTVVTASLAQLSEGLRTDAG